ncbi:MULTISPECIES: transposase domain-containing protein [unclassified Streptomyces]|uniref:transposase domain-containing protein n=1 Tax=unclassified Streptomyces TaxID=2593676 RepID=UPI00359C9D1D
MTTRQVRSGAAARVAVSFVLAMCLFSGYGSSCPSGYRSVMGSLLTGLHRPCRRNGYTPPTGSALTQARQRLGVDPLKALLDRGPRAPAVRGPRWHGGGSGIPPGVLADVQVYTTNANPRVQGERRSPFCLNSRERGVVASDALLTVADLLDDDGYDWCSKCQGYAVRPTDPSCPAIAPPPDPRHRAGTRPQSRQP